MTTNTKFLSSLFAYNGDTQQARAIAISDLTKAIFARVMKNNKDLLLSTINHAESLTTLKGDKRTKNTLLVSALKTLELDLYQRAAAAKQYHTVASASIDKDVITGANNTAQQLAVSFMDNLDAAFVTVKEEAKAKAAKTKADKAAASGTALASDTDNTTDNTTEKAAIDDKNAVFINYDDKGYIVSFEVSGEVITPLDLQLYAQTRKMAREANDLQTA